MTKGKEKKMTKVRKNREAGFTLLEMLMVVVLIGILAAAGVVTYLGYIKSARVAEAVSLAGSALSASQSCAQRNPTVATQNTECTFAKLFSLIGVAAGGLTADGRWSVSIPTVVNLDPTTTPPEWSAGTIKVLGQTGKDTALSAAGIFVVAKAFESHCNLTAAAVADTDPKC